MAGRIRRTMPIPSGSGLTLLPVKNGGRSGRSSETRPPFSSMAVGVAFSCSCRSLPTRKTCFYSLATRHMWNSYAVLQQIARAEVVLVSRAINTEAIPQCVA